MTVTDLFAGAGGSSTGITHVPGLEVTAAANHWQLAVDVHNANHPDTLHVCADISQVNPRAFPRTDILWASPECFPAGTLVLTDRGQVPIEEVRVGDGVLTHKGRWRAVTRVQQSEGRTVSVKGQGHYGLEVTANHKFPLLLQGRRWNNSRRRYERIIKRAATDVPIGTAVISGHERHRWATPVNVESLGLLYDTPFPISNPDFWWLCGRYIADGYADLRENGWGGTVTISVGATKLERDRSRLERLGFVGREVRTAWNFDSRNAELAAWLAREFGHLSTGKRIPAWLHGNPEVAKQILAGYMSGDGYDAGRYLSATTVSKSLAVSLRMLLAEQGYHVSLTRVRQHCDEIEGRELNVQPWLYTVRWEANKSQRTGFVHDGSAWTLIKGIKSAARKSVPVYNLEVEEDHTYIADGIAVCNCTNHSLARGVRDARQPDLFGEILPDAAAERSRATMWDVPRFTEIHQYEAVIVENVVQAKRWIPYEAWLMAMDSLGYEHHELYLNSMHAQAGGLPAPQSRDRIYIVFWRKGNPRPDFDSIQQPDAICSDCGPVSARKVWKRPARRWGRYRAQYTFNCPTCWDPVEPGWLPAATAIDWSIEGQRIGDRARPLAENTRARIAAGIARYWHTDDAAAGLLSPYYGASTSAQSVAEPVGTLTTVDRYALITRHYSLVGRDPSCLTLPAATEPLRTLTRTGRQSLITPGDLEAAEAQVDDALFRMLEPHEVAAGMAFPEDYHWDGTRRERVKLAGNAVTPPAARDIASVIAQSLGHQQ